jgi:hypothetical protein
MLACPELDSEVLGLQKILKMHQLPRPLAKAGLGKCILLLGQAQKFEPALEWFSSFKRF